ncbi:MAG TPA: ATP-binding protein [Candidatus Saccharimonadales bacterium]|nr:ATP-binding protein [Candidatus Saccharimonadales bacterium]
MLLIIISIIAIAATIVFGVIAIIYSVREERAIKMLVENELKQKQRLFEITMMKEIQDRIGYSLEINEVVDVIVGSLDALFKYSVVSSLVLEENKLKFTAHVKEPVSKQYIETVKASMQQSYTAIEANSIEIREDVSIVGAALDDLNHSQPASYFHIPIIVNNKVVSILNVSSGKADNFTEAEMTTLYKIAAQASEALSQLENILTVEKGKLMAMIGSLVDGIFMLDVNGQLTVINDAAKDFLGIAKDDPSTIDLMSALPNSYDFSSKIQRAINHKRVIEEKEVAVDQKIFQIFITPVFDVSITTEKKVIGVSVLLHDITLEKSVAKMKEDFTNIMVHELRSPLTAIKASSELILNPPGPLAEDEKNKIIGLISQQARKMLDEVSLILDAAKLEAGLFTIQKIPGDLKQLITERVQIFEAAAHEKFIKLVVELDPSIPMFNFDTIHVGQVVNNLISNALKFTSSGGTIKISAKPAIGSVIVSVSDTGAGIPKEKQHLLFTKFTQLSGAAHGSVGTGLGLYIVKGVVEAHGGTVSLDSEEGRGTTITFTLPIDGAAKTPATDEQHPALTPANKPQRLVN